MSPPAEPRASAGGRTARSPATARSSDLVERAGRRRWLVKTEPGTYSFGDLLRDGRTAWTGVKNALAQQHLRAMGPGDEVLVYHTGSEKAVVGLAEVAAAPRPDPTAPGTRLTCVDLVPRSPLAHPVTLAHLRGLSALAELAHLADFELLRNSRLSVMPVPPAAWAVVLDAAREG